MTTTMRPMTSARKLPPVDPRMRQRRIAVTRADGRRRLRWLLVGAALVALGGGAFAALHSSLLSVRSINVRGAHHTPVAAIVTAAHLHGVPLVDIDSAAVAARVGRLPWVAGAEVQASWPDGATIVVTERVALARVGTARSAMLVDATGRVLESAGSSPLTLVTGPAPAGAPGTSVAASDLPGLAVVAALPPSLDPSVRAVVVDLSGDVGLELGAETFVELGPAGELQAKFDSLASVLAGVRPRGPVTIDVSIPDAPTVATRALAASNR